MSAAAVAVRMRHGYHSAVAPVSAGASSFTNGGVTWLLRRMVALLSLVLMVGSLSEPAVGALRDGVVHHESAATAAAHGDRFAGDHGHEDGVPSTHTHDRGHLHGTGADHCTHQHGLGPTCGSPEVTQVLATPARTLPSVQMMALTQHPLELFHPPRA